MHVTTAGRGVWAAFVVLAAGVLALVPFFVRVVAWPDMVTPPYFVSRGAALYDEVIIPYTPLLILLVAALGKAFGFSALLFRSVIALSLASTGALVAASALRRRSGPGRAALVVLLGLPLVAAWTLYFEGPALWPDPFLAPLLLAAALVLEKGDRSGDASSLRAGGLLLGFAILVKQTSAWVLVAALVWTCLVSRRRSLGNGLRLLGWASVPYAGFVVLWGFVCRTTAHVYWTFLLPFAGLAGEVSTRPDAADLKETVAPFLVVPATLLIAFALHRQKARASPLVFLAVGTLGMAWPRWGLLHLAGATGLLVALALGSIRALGVAARRMRTRSPSRLAVASLCIGAGLLAVHVGVAILGAWNLAEGDIGGAAYYWDGPEVERAVKLVTDRVGVGGTFLNYSSARETVYVRSGTRPPAGLYINTSYWFFLNKDDLDARLVRALRDEPDTPILFSEPTGAQRGRSIRTKLYRFLKSETDEVERLPDGLSWRRVRRASR
jgi:hypothetical protein